MSPEPADHLIGIHVVFLRPWVLGNISDGPEGANPNMFVCGEFECCAAAPIELVILALEVGLRIFKMNKKSIIFTFFMKNCPSMYA